VARSRSTDETLAAAERLGDSVGLRARIMPRWGELQLQAEERDARRISVVAADPTGVNMDRVASTMRAIEELGAGRLSPAAAREAIRAISEVPPAPTWLFTLAAAAGAVELAVLFGVRHLPAGALILVSAAAGAIARRSLAQYSANAFLQPFCAALLAGVIGALAVRYDEAFEVKPSPLKEFSETLQGIVRLKTQFVSMRFVQTRESTIQGDVIVNCHFRLEYELYPGSGVSKIWVRPPDDPAAKTAFTWKDISSILAG